MTGILEFDLPEDQYEYNAAIFGWRYLAAIHNLDEKLFQWQEHGHEFKDVDGFMQFLQELLREEAPEAFLNE